MTNYRKILVAVDLSPEAKPVLARARELREFYAADLCLIHVVEPLVTTSDFELSPELPFDSRMGCCTAARRSRRVAASPLQFSVCHQHLQTANECCVVLRFAPVQQVDGVWSGTKAELVAERGGSLPDHVGDQFGL